MKDFSNVKRSRDWRIYLSSESAEAIDDLVAAIERQDLMNFDLYLEDCAASFRTQSPEDEAELRNYYLAGGWKTDAVFE